MLENRWVRPNPLNPCQRGPCERTETETAATAAGVKWQRDGHWRPLIADNWQGGPLPLSIEPSSEPTNVSAISAAGFVNCHLYIYLVVIGIRHNNFHLMVVTSGGESPQCNIQR